MRNIILILPLLAVGCASGPSHKPDASGMPAEVPKPTYTEKVGAVRGSELKAAVNCPHDMNYEKEDWRKQVAYANACVRAKDWFRADKVGNSLAKSAPLTPWGPYFMALAAVQRNDYPRAQWMLELALKKAPNEGIFHYELGRLFWETGDDAGAIKEMKQASELNAALTQAHLVVGQLALQKGDYSEARRVLGKALANDAHYAPALLALAEVEIRASDYGKAEGYLTQVLAQNPRASKARLALAQLQEQHLQKVKEALENYRALKQLSAEHKLDEGVQVNLDEKIQTLEKSLPQVSTKGSQLTDRRPSAERQVKK